MSEAEQFHAQLEATWQPYIDAGKNFPSEAVQPDHYRQFWIYGPGVFPALMRHYGVVLNDIGNASLVDNVWQEFESFRVDPDYLTVYRLFTTNTENIYYRERGTRWAGETAKDFQLPPDNFSVVQHDFIKPGEKYREIFLSRGF